MKNAVIYACSHRRGGNTDHAVDLLAKGVCEAGGKADIIHIRNHEIISCLACGFCDKSIHHHGRERCVLGEKDETWELFKPLFSAPTVIFASPIYFYHLPSIFKTLIDRSQQFWTAKNTGEPWVANLPNRTAHALFVAGRPKGEKLFDGAEITLKYFLNNFNFTLSDPHVFRGLDERDDLSKQADSETQIIKLGKHAWETAS
jgi:multimeric flavodoxin WrbA